MQKKEIPVASLAVEVGLSDGILVLRPKAAEMLDLSKKTIGSVLYGDILVCNFAGIVDCSSSFVDEFVVGWQRIVSQAENAMLILINFNPDVRYTIEAALNQRNRISHENLCLIAQTDDQYEVLGRKIEKNVLQVFDLLANGSHVTARLIADRFGIELNSAGNRLKKLFDAHMALRSEQSVDAGGKYEYYIPKV